MISHKLIEILTVVFAASTIFLVIVNQPQTGDTFGTKGGMLTTRRGFEKQMYQATIVSAVIMFVLVLASQIFK